MVAEELGRYVTAVPFRPFVMNVADGRRVPVIGRDFILISPAGRTLHIYQRDESFDVLDTMLVTGISFDPPPVETPTNSARTTRRPPEPTP